MDNTNHYTARLEQLKEAYNYRSFPKSRNINTIDLCSNDYLGVASDKALYDEFMERNSLQKYPLGACSSRLLGVQDTHTAFEKVLSEAYNKEAALLFNSGYHANVGILSALAQKDDLIIADKLIHASIIDGMRLCEATFLRYRHLDYEHLKKTLEKYRDNFKNVFIVSESIFSMDGDVADLKQLVVLKKRYDTFLYVDEAHALGVRGDKGLGYAEESDCIDDIDFIVGTCGKSLASVGGFLVCNALFKEFLINHSRSLIFSTALPPVNVAWSQFIFEKMLYLQDKRQALAILSKQFAELLGQTPNTHIVPYLVGENDEAIKLSKCLQYKGFNVLPIRYPTVPKHTARLRFSLHAAMNLSDLLPVKDVLSLNKNAIK